MTAGGDTRHCSQSPQPVAIGAEHSQGWLSRFGATSPGGPMGQFLQERRAQQLPWHQQVWAGLDHPGTARIWGTGAFF